MSYTPHRHSGQFSHLIKKDKDQYEAECKETSRILRNIHADSVKTAAKARYISKKDMQQYVNIFKEIRHFIVK